MYQPKRAGNPVPLIALIAAATLFAFVSGFWQGPTGRSQLDGGLGVVLGLFVSSRAAANLLDMILYGLKLRPTSASRASSASWVVLNVATLFAGWVLIVQGTTRFVK